MSLVVFRGGLQILSSWGGGGVGGQPKMDRLTTISRAVPFQQGSRDRDQFIPYPTRSMLCLF